MVFYFQNLEVRIKWPNDIYFGSTMKLGGVLVKSSIMVNNIHCNIGEKITIACSLEFSPTNLMTLDSTCDLL